MNLSLLPQMAPQDDPLGTHGLVGKSILDSFIPFLDRRKKTQGGYKINILTPHFEKFY